MDTSIKVGIKSDHDIISLSLPVNEPKRGPGLWKLICSVLKVPEYKNRIRALITETWEDVEDKTDMGVRFDYLKFKIYRVSLKFCRTWAKGKRKEETEIHKQLEIVDKRICEKLANDMDILHYQNLKQSLEALEEEKAGGAWIRSRLEFIEEHERNTAYFYKCKV